MAKSLRLAGHELRQANQKRYKQALIKKAENLVAAYLEQHQPFDPSEMAEHYQNIDMQVSEIFTTPNNYRYARQGFLNAIRDYNKANHCSLDEPVVPIVAERDSLNISYEWFVEGSKVSDTWEAMQLFWQHKRKFSANDYVTYFLYSSIMFGGLNDVPTLKALYRWLFSERKLHLLNLSKHSVYHKELNPDDILLVIPLEISDEKYGCRADEIDSDLTRYVTYIPDDISLMFLYALGDIDLNKRKIQQFETIIKGLNKKFELTCRDAQKIHLSHLIKYANFNWRQLPDSHIDGANSLVMQGQIKTTSLPTEQLLTYNQESIQSLSSPITWQQLFIRKPSSNNNPTSTKEYPTFSKNLIQLIQEALKGSRPYAINTVTALQTDFLQPNAKRLLGWVSFLLGSNQTNLNSISKYIGCIGREWLMLTLDEDLAEWGTDDFEDIYEQIILSKVKDARKKDVLQKDPIDDRDDIELNEDDIKDINIDDALFDLTVSAEEDGESKSVDRKTSSLDELKNTQSYTYGRLRAFHLYQMKYFDAPEVSFAWGQNKQVVKVSMVSPKVYRAMQSALQASELNNSQKLLCQTVLILAYRTGMRINELAGIKIKDIENHYNPSIVLTPNPYLRLKSSSAKRRLLLTALLKKHERETLTLFIAQQKRMGATYLFSQGASKQPLATYFFSNLMQILWDGLLGQDNHNYTFHSLRHTAISQLALVINQSALAQVMTDYTKEDCENIATSLAGYHQTQGAWFGLASFVGHLTCDTTFEHYIHTAHLLAGWQLSKAKLEIPFTVLQNITDIDYQKLNYHDKTAYDKTTKQVELKKLRPYFAKTLKVHHSPLFASPDANSQPVQQRVRSIKSPSALSVFIDPRYDAVIAFIKEIDNTKPALRLKELENIAIKQGLHLLSAQKLYQNANKLNNNDKLIVHVKGQKTQELITLALDRAYKMSIDHPEILRQFVSIYKKKHITSRSYLKFGIKKSQHELLASFMKVGCQLVDAQYWQLVSSSEKKVKDFKKKHKLDNAIRIGANKKCEDFEVRIIKKVKSQSINETSYESSGVLKFLGGILAIQIE